MQCYFF